MPKRIYLDYAATTPVSPKALRAMLPFLKKEYGNPSSIHSFGQKALGACDEARQKVSKFLGCSPQEIIFTGSATEANNLAIRGVVSGRLSQKPHMITSKIEHPAVSELCRALEKKGIEVTFLPVDKEGQVRISDVEGAIKANTVLVSIMYANNEIGAIQSIQEIGQLIQAESKKTGNKIFFHTDAVQAVNYLDCDVNYLGVDLLTISSHKIYGPKGMGALYIRKGTSINPLIYGGGQEAGLRPGTENVPGIVGLGAAIEEIQKDPLGGAIPKIRIKGIIVRKLRDKLINGILKNIPNSKLNGSKTDRLPNNVNFSFRGAEGEAQAIALDQKGIAVSTGSACSSKTLAPSHVLMALGLSEEEAHCSLRITLGRYTTETEIGKLLKVLPQIIERLRKISGYK